MRRPGGLLGDEPRVPMVLQVLSVAYVAFFLAMTLLPIEWSHELSRWPGNRGAQLVPVEPVASAILVDHRLTAVAEAGGNVLMFVPFGCLLPLVLGPLDRGRRVALAACCTSVLIELYQLRMPGVRRADVNDVLANTLGAALGWAALGLVERWLARTHRPTLRQLARPDHAKRDSS